jgi:uncharacterized membrane protein
MDLLKSSEIGKMLITFVVSMLPVIELRGAIPVGVAMGLHPVISAAVSVVGNLVPIPFIIIFIRRIFAWMRNKSKKLGSIVQRLEDKALAKGDALYKGEVIGLMIFVAIPLPGTGAWTGALIAAILGIRMKAALPAIAAGVVIAGILVLGITYGFTKIF